MRPISACAAALLVLGATLTCGCGTGSTRPTPVACSYTLSVSSFSFGAPGGTGAVTVSADAGCSWTARADASWLSITNGATGTGEGVVSFSATTNTATAARTGSLTVAGRSVSVSQDGAVCQYVVSPIELTPCMPAAQLTTSVTTEAGCPWTATADPSWMTVIAGGSGTGPGTITFRVSDNWDAPRSGVLMVRWPTPTAGQNVRVLQAGCYYAVNPESFSFVAAGGPASFWVLQYSDPYTCGGPLQDACVWSAHSDASWIAITSTMPRAGDNPVRFTVEPNTTGASRTGTIAVRDKVVRITQGR